VKWIHRKYNSGPEHFELIGSWRAGGATTLFKKHMGEIVEKAVNHIIIPNDFTLVHEQANVLDFLSTHHLQQIYDVIVSALSQPPHHVLAENFIKNTLLTTCMMARLNKERYFTASKKQRHRRHRIDRLVQSVEPVPIKNFCYVTSSASLVVQRERQEHLTKNSHSTECEKRRKKRRFSSPLAQEFNWFRLKYNSSVA